MKQHPAFLVVALATLSPLSAAVRLPSLFSDHMVLQRDAAVPVWGWADPGEEVTVRIAGQQQSTKADANGKWSTKLEKLTATGPQTMTVKGSNEITIRDVLLGEVWLASGQSNMGLKVRGVNHAKDEITNAKFPQIRMFTVERKTAVTPQAECGGYWQVCSPETVASFSATAYFFGRDLHQSLKVPVGLIDASWGGTRIESWTSLEAQQSLPALAPLIESWRKRTATPFDEVQAKARHAKQMEVWKNQSAKSKAAGERPPQQPREIQSPQTDPKGPANLFNGMIVPLAPYAIRGAIWYQGEANAGGNAKLYTEQLPRMIRDWRKLWGQGDFHFISVQLPGYKEPTDDPGAASGWALIREALLKSRSLPNTGTAIVIDAGSATTSHPRDKQTVGKRLALWARANVYGEKISSSGPLPAGHEFKNDTIILKFTHTDGGLKSKDAELKGFAIAGEDRKWVWATARIEGDQVIVSSPEVKAPIAVRYAWADNPPAPLINGAGLPASPFRTDDW
jgi:hypothetical protein